jgi:L-threonylcarbamoyladenylate synthase
MGTKTSLKFYKNKASLSKRMFEIPAKKQNTREWQAFPYEKITQTFNLTDQMTDQIDTAVTLLRSGEVVAFPTETVYGLGANIFDVKAIQKIYTTKNRPSTNPLIAHISDISQLSNITQDIPDIAFELAKEFWPGPLTLVLPKKSIVPNLVSAGLDTIAVRMPANPIALTLISKVGFPLVAPSANPSTRPSPTHHRHVENYFDGHIFTIQGGRCTYGVESTILNPLTSPPTLLRAGAITVEELESFLDTKITIPSSSKNTPILAPGMSFLHYAPKAKLILVDSAQDTLEIITQQKTLNNKIGIMGTTDFVRNFSQDDLIIKDLGIGTKEALHNLFSTLIEFDATEVNIIVAQTFPKTGYGLALMDKLERASRKL